MRTFLSLLLALAVGPLLVLAPSPADGISFTRIIDTGTPLPGGAGTVDLVSPVAFSNTGVVVNAFYAGGEGYYHVADDGTITTLVDTDTLLPDGSGDFTPADIGYAAVDRQTGALSFSNDDRSAVYATSGGSVRLVADDATPIPGVDPPAPFRGISGSFTADGGTIAFHGYQQTPFVRGIYTDVGGVLSALVDGSTPVPDTTAETFTFTQHPVHLAGETVFEGFGSTVGGIYRESNGTIEQVIDDQATIPLGLDRLDTNAIDYDGTTIAFEQDDVGVLTYDGISLEQVVDYAGDLGIYAPISGNVAVEGSIVAGTVLEGLNLTTHGFATLDGVLLPIPVPFDEFDGGTVLRSGILDVAGDQLLLAIHFSDGSSAGYLVTVPEPGTLLLLTCGLLGMAARTRTARRRLPAGLH